MNKNRKSSRLAIFTLCLAALTGCQQDLTPITRAIQGVGRQVTTAQQAANAAQQAAATAQQAANAAQTTATSAVNAINADGGVNNQVTELQRRIRALEACTPGSDGYANADCDGDFVNNEGDACPTVSNGNEPLMHTAVYTRRGCIDTDRDSDGVGDSQDICPTEARGEHEDMARRGCPTPDTDGDGVFDNEDECRTVAKGEHPDAAHNGCPTGGTPDPDTDGDGVRDERDECDDQVAGDEPHPTRLGCPAPDRDHDGRPDHWDGCPDTAVRHQGSDGNMTSDPEESVSFPGCPQGTVPTTSTNTNVTAADPTPVAPPTPTPVPAPGNTTQVVQGDPSAPTPAPAPVAASTEDTTNGNAVMVALGDNAAATQRFCTLDRRALAAIQLAGTSECAQGEKFCFRLVNSDVMPTACDPRTPAPGCVTAGGSMNICRPGAESVMVVRYGASLQDRTPAGVAAAVTAQNQPRQRRASHRRSRHGIAFGWDGVSLY